MKKILTLTMCLAMALSLLSGCGESTNQNTEPAQTNATAVEQKAVYFSSYDELYTAVQTATEENLSGTSEAGGAASDTAAVTEEYEAESDTDVPRSEEADYSETNVQVDGVDEKDIVKTDGQYIYLLRSNELVILRAAGEDTKVLSQTTVGEDYLVEGDEEQDYTEQYKWSTGMYIADGRVIVLSSCFNYHTYKEDEDWLADSAVFTSADIFDVSDPAHPELIECLGQDGSPLDSRLSGGKLYLITEWYTDAPEQDKLESFVPGVYRGGEHELIAANDICACPSNNETRYINVSVIDVEDGEIEKTQSLLGGGEVVYMNTDSLYLADTVMQNEESEPYKKSVYTVVDYNNNAYTELTRFDVAGGTLSYAASGQVDGYLHDQYSMDEKDGNLRIVTTASSYNYSIYTDEEMDFTNYVPGDSSESNALYVLDSELNIIGSVTDLAPDEQVYSVRFDGDYGYICTFEEVDPLFAVDLSDPTAPTVLSALKIPGFSDYLHVWSDGRLFGLGQNTRTEGSGDDEWITTDGIKLSMFDTSDPTNVIECANLAVDADSSEALYNPRAILISYDRNLIAFPTEEGYLIYGYDDQNGFVLKAQIQLDDGFVWNSRGLYIDDLFYVVSEDNVTVIDLNSLAITATIPIARG